MSEQKEGTKLSVLGPLGNGYGIYKNKKALLAGGGTGIYSLLALAAVYGTGAVAAMGFRSAGLINTAEDFAGYGARVSVITDDGSNGRKGFVTDLVREELGKGDTDIVYICGPFQMMANAVKIVNEFGVECEVSMEERMGCGVGACQACVCKAVASEGENYKRVCVDGPVFKSEEILWK